MTRHLLNLAVLGAAGALLLGACTVKEPQPQTEAAPEQVTFDAYMNRGVATKSGEKGELVLDNLKTAGFGVFGYYTNDVLYSQAFLPNFMYNERVRYSASKWSYAIPKYWPNEFGSNAESENVDRVSFFAYAPWVNVEPSTGLADDQTYGITKVTRATDSGDPKVSYLASFTPANCVDLCWGVAKVALGDTQSLGGADAVNNVAVGNPFLNVSKLKSGEKLSYDFKHALAALNIQIDAAVDAAIPGNAVDADTRIYVRSVTFQGFATEGQLNLNSSAANPVWKNYDGNGTVSTAPATIYDGRRDGREANAEATTEVPQGLNPAIVQASLNTEAGVTKDAVNLFNPGTGDATTPIYVVPNDDVLKVTIVYDVETVDPDILNTYLANGTTHGSVIENVITQVVKDGSGNEITMQAGKKYTLKLHLGMASAKFTGEVADWGAKTDGSADLPANN